MRMPRYTRIFGHFLGHPDQKFEDWIIARVSIGGPDGEVHWLSWTITPICRGSDFSWSFFGYYSGPTWDEILWIVPCTPLGMGDILRIWSLDSSCHAYFPRHQGEIQPNMGKLYFSACHCRQLKTGMHARRSMNLQGRRWVPTLIGFSSINLNAASLNFFRTLV